MVAEVGTAVGLVNTAGGQVLAELMKSAQWRRTMRQCNQWPLQRVMKPASLACFCEKALDHWRVFFFFHCTRKGYQPPHIHRACAPSHNKHGPINMQMPLQTLCLGHKAFCLVYNPGSLQKTQNNILCLCNWACLWHTTELPRGRMVRHFGNPLQLPEKKERKKLCLCGYLPLSFHYQLLVGSLQLQ